MGDPRGRHEYRVAWPAEVLLSVWSARPLTDEQVRARAERIARQFLDNEDGCDVLGETTERHAVRVYILGPKAYRETDGQPGDFAVVDHAGPRTIEEDEA